MGIRNDTLLLISIALLLFTSSMQYLLINLLKRKQAQINSITKYILTHLEEGDYIKMIEEAKNFDTLFLEKKLDSISKMENLDKGLKKEGEKFRYLDRCNKALLKAIKNRKQTNSALKEEGERRAKSLFSMSSEIEHLKSDIDYYKKEAHKDLVHYKNSREKANSLSNEKEKLEKEIKELRTNFLEIADKIKFSSYSLENLTNRLVGTNKMIQVDKCEKFVNNENSTCN